MSRSRKATVAEHARDLKVPAWQHAVVCVARGWSATHTVTERTYRRALRAALAAPVNR